jgi:putative membrane protein
MKIIFSILLNALILFIMALLLWENLNKWVEAWIVVVWSWKAYLLGWIILWLINVTIKPILKILSLPLFLVFFWLVVFIVNAIVLKVFDYIINNILIIPWVSYNINWWINFIIAVTIFTILNMLFSLLGFKKSS